MMDHFITGFLFGFFGGVPLVLYFVFHNHIRDREDARRLNEELKRWRK